MAKQSSVNLDITNNADGFDISGGTTPRKLGITGGDVTIAGSGSATVTFPTTSTTIAGLGITQSFSALQSFSAGISAAGSTFSSTTNTLDVIASTEGAGLRIARAVTGAGSRVGGIRLGRSGTTAQNTYLENSSGAFTVYNGVDNTATAFASFSGTAVTIGATTASQLTLNCPGTVNIGDAGYMAHNQKFTLDGSTRFFTFGDSNGTTAGFMGINRVYNGLCADYALEVNSPTGKGLQLIYNDHTGAASNWVNMDVSSAGNYTVLPSGGLATITGTLNVSAGVCAAGATFSGNVSAQSTLYTDNIQAIGNQINIANAAGGRIAFGDYDGAGNSTYVFIRDATSSLLISNPYGGIAIGDPNNVDSGYALVYDSAAGSLDGGNSALTNFYTGSFNGLLTASAGISAAGGATFSGTVASDTGYRITSNAIKALTGTTYTFLESDNGKVLTFNNGSAVTVTIPTALPVGFNCTAIQLGTGQVGFTAASGLTMQSYGSQYRLIGQHAAASIIEYSANIVNLSGNLVT